MTAPAVAPTSTLDDVTSFASALLAARTQAHIFHLQTRSYSRHKALGTFYDAIGELFDTYVETYQGAYELIPAYVPPAQLFAGDDAVLPYFEELTAYVTECGTALPQDADLVNLHADVLQLLHQTMYKLTYLA